MHPVKKDGRQSRALQLKTHPTEASFEGSPMASCGASPATVSDLCDDYDIDQPVENHGKNEVPRAILNYEDHPTEKKDEKPKLAS